MGIPEKWQVDKDLQQNLQTMNITTEIGNELDVNIRALMREMDDQIFSVLLKKFVTKFLEHESTQEFGQFFEREYSSPPSNLDVDYRRHSEVHTNYKLEAMLRVLKTVHFKNLKMRRIDFSIYRLLKMCWDNLFNRLTYLNDEGDSYTMEILRDRHSSALSIPRKNITKNNHSFEIQSRSNPCVTYFIEMNCVACSCQIRCPECCTCLHVYSCNCVDYSVAGNFCKHVHAVCIYEKTCSPLILKYSDQELVCQEEIISSDDVPPASIDDTKYSYSNTTRDELIKTLLHMTSLLQTNSYKPNVYVEGAKFIKKALNLFNEANILKSEKAESSITLLESKYNKISSKLTHFDVPEITCEEPISEELPVDTENHILVDDVVEEVVYVDDVHTAYDAFS